MALAHVYFNDQLQYGRMLRRALSLLKESDELLAEVRDVMLQMRDGDGTQDVHYAEVTTRFGFPNDAKARAAYEGVDLVYGKMSVNSSVTNVRGSRDQLFAKLRG